MAQIYTNLFQCLSHSCNCIVLILGIALTAWESDMSVPLVADSSCPLDEQYLWVAMLHPVLLKESI